MEDWASVSSRLGLWLDSFVRGVCLRRDVLMHRLGFRRDAPVRLIGLRRGVPGHWLGLRARCSCRFRHSGALGGSLREQGADGDAEEAV